MKSTAITLVKDHKRLRELDRELADTMSRFEQEETFFRKQLETMQKKYKDEHKKIWDQMEQYLREVDLLPESFDRDNPNHRLRMTNSGVIDFEEYDGECCNKSDMPKEVRDFLNRIFT